MRIVKLADGQSPDMQLLRRESVFESDITQAAMDIITAVRERGDDALREYTLQLDQVDLQEFRVSEEQIHSAVRQVSEDVKEALQIAAASIIDFHRRQVRQSFFDARSDGSLVGSRVTPLASVGVYVPGGRAQYPSTVLMNVLPARVAGVKRIVMVTPPQSDGKVDPVTLAAASIAGATEIYAVGGAQAVAALAYGTNQIEAVDKITGPGNAYVAAAKRLVSGDVGIDMIAGPSEVLVLADETARADLIAIDLMAQAEHDPKAACYLVTTDEYLVADVEEAIEAFLERSPRADITRKSLDDNGLALICPNLATALLAVNTIAPEHLEIQMGQPMELLGLIDNAGAIFLGPWTPESVGDYVAGPNHTLPTGGTARFSSPLSVDDFCKRSSVISYSYAALEKDAAAIETIADCEGLWAHAQAVRHRIALAEEYTNAEEDGQ